MKGKDRDILHSTFWTKQYDQFKFYNPNFKIQMNLNHIKYSYDI